MEPEAQRVRERSNAGRRNLFVCPRCLAVAVTVDRDRGLTPPAIACVRCGRAFARSLGYPEEAALHEAMYEFYAPDAEEVDRLKAAGQLARLEWVARGGLLLRRRAVVRMAPPPSQDEREGP